MPRNHTSAGFRFTLAAVCAAGLWLVACDNMDDQPRHEPMEPSGFFRDGMSARQPVPGTVARGQLMEDRPFHTGRDADGLLVRNPLPVTLQTLQRGRVQFDIFCSPCHGLTGEGDGMIVQRGFPAPPTYHSDRLRQVPEGHLFDVITTGYGKMPAYRAQVPPQDRWSIVAYMRALQRSQTATIEDVPPEHRPELERVP